MDRVEAVMAGDVMDIPHPLDDDQLSDLAAGREIRPSARIPTDVPVCSGCGHYPSSRQKYSCASCGAVMALDRLRDTAVVIHGPRSCAYLMDSAYLSTVADLYTGGEALGGSTTFYNYSEISKRNGRVYHYVFPDGTRTPTITFNLAAMEDNDGTATDKDYTFSFAARLRQATWYKVNTTVKGLDGSNTTIELTPDNTLGN